MANMTGYAFLTALSEKFEATELVELLGLTVDDIIEIHQELILQKQAMLEDELKYGH